MRVCMWRWIAGDVMSKVEPLKAIGYSCEGVQCAIYSAVRSPAYLWDGLGGRETVKIMGMAMV